LRLPAKILLGTGIICGLVGLAAKLLPVSRIDGPVLILIGILYILFAFGSFDPKGGFQTNKQKLFDWICLILLLAGGLLTYF
jgi:hypothetical protein